MKSKEIAGKGTWTEEYLMQKDLLFPYQIQILLTFQMQNSKIRLLQIKGTVVLFSNGRKLQIKSYTI